MNTKNYKHLSPIDGVDIDVLMSSIRQNTLRRYHSGKTPESYKLNLVKKIRQPALEPPLGSGRTTKGTTDTDFNASAVSSLDSLKTKINKVPILGSSLNWIYKIFALPMRFYGLQQDFSKRAAWIDRYGEQLKQENYTLILNLNKAQQQIKQLEIRASNTERDIKRLISENEALTKNIKLERNPKSSPGNALLTNMQSEPSPSTSVEFQALSFRKLLQEKAAYLSAELACVETALKSTSLLIDSLFLDQSDQPPPTLTSSPQDRGNIEKKIDLKEGTDGKFLRTRELRSKDHS